MNAVPLAAVVTLALWILAVNWFTFQVGLSLRSLVASRIREPYTAQKVTQYLFAELMAPDGPRFSASLGADGSKLPSIQSSTEYRVLKVQSARLRRLPPNIVALLAMQGKCPL